MFKIMKGWYVFFIPVFLIFITSMSILSTEKHSQPKSSSLNGGTITGTISFSDEYPEREKITTTKDQQICGAFKFSESFVVSEETKGLQNAVITLLNVQGGNMISEGGKVTLDQKKCQYVPHVQAVPVGSQLEILNNDGIPPSEVRCASRRSQGLFAGCWCRREFRNRSSLATRCSSGTCDDAGRHIASRTRDSTRQSTDS